MTRRAMRPRRRPAQQTGLSMIELMVTLTITAILLGVAVPSMYEMIARRRVAAVAIELASDLRYLNSSGLQRNMASQLDISDRCYVVSLDALGFGSCDCSLPAPCGNSAGAPIVLKSVVLPTSAGVTFAYNRANTAFNSQGLLNPLSPTPLAVTISSSNGGRVKVYTQGAISRPYACSLEHQESSFPVCVVTP